MKSDPCFSAPAPRRWATLLVLSLGLSSCAVYEALGGMPSAEITVPLKLQPGTERVLNCVRTSILALSPEVERTLSPEVRFKSRSGWWATEVTLFDLDRGVMETGRYPETNVAGVRVRAVHDVERASLRIHLKAAGPYYTDLGAQKHMDQLMTVVKACLDDA